MTTKKYPSDITETPPPVTPKPNVYQDVPPTQADILAFIDNPENINKAVEGSMAKRNEVLNRKDPSTKKGLSRRVLVRLLLLYQIMKKHPEVLIHRTRRFILTVYHKLPLYK